MQWLGHSDVTCSSDSYFNVQGLHSWALSTIFLSCYLSPKLVFLSVAIQFEKESGLQGKVEGCNERESKNANCYEIN